MGLYSSDGHLNVTLIHDLPGVYSSSGAIQIVDANASINRVTVLDASPVASSHTGNTNETVLATVTIPAGVMGTDGLLRVSADWTVTNSANDKTLRIRLGGIGGTALTGTAFTTVTNAFHRMVIANRNAANSQIASTNRSRATDLVSQYEIATAAIDTSVQQTLVITAQLEVGTETATLENYLVELINP